MEPELLNSCSQVEVLKWFKRMGELEDVDKVVEQMEEYVKESSNVDYNRTMIETIEIVKSGGIE